MFRNYTLLLFAVIMAESVLFAQTGPGGVGNKTTNMLWLKADQITGTADSAVISVLPDISGNDINAIQPAVANKPLFYNNVLNGKPILRFDGTNHYMNTVVKEWGEEFTAMVAVIPGNWATGYARILETKYSQHFFLGRSSTAVYKLIVANNSFPYGTCNGGTINNGTADIVGITYSHNGTDGPGNLYENGSLVATNTFAKPTNDSMAMYIGSDYILGNKYKGDIAEILYWNTKLNDAQRIIAENYLSSKYNITMAANDYYAHDAAAPAAAYRADVSGIGRVDASSIHNDAVSARVLQINNPSAMDDGEFMLFGHNDSTLTFTPTGAPTGKDILRRVWRMDITGDVGAIDLIVLTSGFTGMGDDLFLLIDADGDFTAGATIIALSQNSADTFSTSGLSIPDDSYIAIARTECIVVPGDASMNTEYYFSGETATMQLTGQDTAATIQWQVSFNGDAFSDIPGATSNPFTTDALDSANSYVFRANVTNVCSAYSNELEITFIQHKYIIISGIDTSNQNATANTMDVQFDIAWGESWRNTTTWDAAWVFGKFRVGNGPWKRMTMTISPSDLTLPAGVDAEIGHDGSLQAWGDLGLGFFLYRDATGSGNNNWRDVGFKWDYDADTLTDTDVQNAEIQLFGIDMVFVPSGGFHVGSGGSGHSHFYKNAVTTSTYQITSNAPIQVNSGVGYLNYQLTGGSVGFDDQGDRLGPIPVEFPKGIGAFYTMKYPITQQQYADFLNTLDRTQQTARCAVTTPGKFINDVAGGAANTIASYRNGIRLLDDPGTPYSRVFGNDYNANYISGETTDGQYIACNWLSYIDEWAFADWSGLRPITELEYEKMSRGTEPPVPNEYAWGTATDTIRAMGLLNPGSYNETVFPPNANCQIGYHAAGDPAPIQGPVRVGCYGSFGGSRIERGTTFYGIFDVSGGLWERTVTVGTPEGRAFDGSHGDGMIEPNGLYSIPTLQQKCMGYRGGDYEYEAGYERTSDRFHGSNLCPSGICYYMREATFGGRCGRTSDGCSTASSEAGNNQNICGTTVTLSGDTAWNSDSIIWSTSGTGSFDNNNQLHPEYSASAADITAGSVYLYLYVYSTCENAEDSVLITFNPVPSASISGDTTICSGDSTQITITLAGTSPWNFVISDSASTDTINGVTTSPFTMYVDPGDTTTYTLVAMNDLNCQGSVSGSAIITVIPTPATPDAGGNNPVCSGDTLFLTASDISGATYNWVGPAGFSSYEQNPIIYNISTGYSGQFIVFATIGTCTSSGDTVNIVVHQTPSIDAGGPQTICATDAALLQAAGANYTSLAWSSSGNGSFSQPSSLQTSYTPGASDISYGFSILTISASTAYCAAHDNVVITISTGPKIAMPASQGFCAEQPFVPSSVSITDYTSVLWSSSGTGYFNDSTLVLPEYYPSDYDAAAWSLYLTVIATSSCGTQTDSMLLVIKPAPVIEAGPDVTINAGEITTLTASGATSYIWSPADFLSCSSCVSPDAFPLATTVYTVQAVGSNGCYGYDSLTVTVEMAHYYFIPSAFSPNGDSHNDLLYVRGAGIQSMEFKIFDRWGQIVFETTDPKIGWDGSFRGQPLDPGVFIYDAYLRFWDESHIEAHGNVTLIR
ncbi:MAG: gliding motility-associated C-terminal domain-containing protein [Bacteroidetes bacterium]|nr:gliding motility-associated C-terminal domain-containing protein [Bacteroidota bacterium]